MLVAASVRARFMAARHDVDVEGVDLTPEFVEVGVALTREVGLGEKVRLMRGSALDLPQDSAAFDRAIMFHVGMNIEDKTALFAEIARVLKPGGICGVYDVMTVGDAELDYPVAWAQDESTSFVADVATYRTAIEAAGLSIYAVETKKNSGWSFSRRSKREWPKAARRRLGCIS